MLSTDLNAQFAGRATIRGWVPSRVEETSHVIEDSRRLGTLVHLLTRVCPDENLVLVGPLPKHNEPIGTWSAGPIWLKEGRFQPSSDLDLPTKGLLLTNRHPRRTYQA